MNAEASYLAKTTEASQCERQLDEGDKAAALLREAVETLELKLAAVLRGEDEADSAGVPEEMLVPLADRMRDHNKRVTRAAEKIRNLTRRLEV